jgi:hypothetical protein
MSVQKKHSVRLLSFLLPLCFGQFAFVSCTTVRKDDHSYTYIYQHNVQPPSQPQYSWRPAERASSEIAADGNVATVAPQIYAAAPAYTPAQIQYAEPSQADVYNPPMAQRVCYQMPPRAYFQLPQLRVPMPVYNPPVILGMSLRNTPSFSSAGQTYRSGCWGSGSVLYSAPSSRGSLCASYPKGR